MSYSVNIITSHKLEPMAICQAIASSKFKLVVTSDQFPSLRMGIENESLRGIEVSEEKNGYEVTVFSYSSFSDYVLFIRAIWAIKHLTGGQAISEEGETINDPFQKFTEEWIDRDMQARWEVICIMVRHSGAMVTLYGLFFPFCVGPKMLQSRNIKLYPPFEGNEKGYKWLTEYFTLIQWSLANGKDTSSRLAIPVSNDTNREPLGISMITIENNEVCDFDYVSYAPLMGIMNLDTHDSVLIRFEDFRRAVATTDMYIDSLAGIDECQMRICSSKAGKDSDQPQCGGKADVDEIKNILETAKRYVPGDVTYRPTYPGSGYDEKQNTFILMWNPENSKITLEEYVKSIQRFYVKSFKQRIHEWKNAKMDDRFYVVKVGDGKTGIVMAGVFSSQPYLQSDSTGKGARQHYMELKPTMMLNPQTIPMLTIEEIENAVTGFMWRGGYSGRKLTAEQAQSLETLYASYLKTIEEQQDGVNLCIIERL